MTIKSDKWIRRMAQTHGMIEPFEAEQVRSLDGRRVVSFGTSSYGYDIRCAREFKIFTNINSTIVDPKNFDEKSFVDFTGDVSNTTPLPAKIYAGEGCAQVLFFESDEVCETSYRDRGGKYQGQKGVTLPKT